MISTEEYDRFSKDLYLISVKLERAKKVLLPHVPLNYVKVAASALFDANKAIEALAEVSHHAFTAIETPEED